jgi:hypothetical protein
MNRLSNTIVKFVVLSLMVLTAVMVGVLPSSGVHASGGYGYGPPTCITGDVWRNAFTGDDICVTTDQQQQVSNENSLASSRWMAVLTTPHACTLENGVQLVWRAVVPVSTVVGYTEPPIPPGYTPGYIGDDVCIPPVEKTGIDQETAAAFTTWAEDLYGADTCVPGYIWRQATPSDHVCVTATEREQVAYDNTQAAARSCGNEAVKDPGCVAAIASYGNIACVNGFVWRGAYSGDVVCVTGSQRTQVTSDNSQASTRLSNLPAPTATPTITPTATATNTPTPAATSTPAPTATYVPSATPTSTVTPIPAPVIKIAGANLFHQPKGDFISSCDAISATGLKSTALLSSGETGIFVVRYTAMNPGSNQPTGNVIFKSNGQTLPSVPLTAGASYRGASTMCAESDFPAPSARHYTGAFTVSLGPVTDATTLSFYVGHCAHGKTGSKGQCTACSKGYGLSKGQCKKKAKHPLSFVRHSSNGGRLTTIPVDSAADNRPVRTDQRVRAGYARRVEDVSLASAR